MVKKLVKKLKRKVPNVKLGSTVKIRKPTEVKPDAPELYERQEILRILQMIKPGIANRTLVESMTYFLLSGQEIITYNDRISIQHPFKTPFSAFIKADTFFNVMSKSTVQYIDLVKIENDVKVKAKGLNVNLPTVEDDEIINRIKAVAESLEEAAWSKLPENFIDCITLCSFAASKSESESTLSCVRIADTLCIASDNNRIAKAELKSSMEDLFIKASEIKSLVSINPIAYFGSKSWLHFKNENGCIFSIRRIEGEYPDFLPHFEFEGDRVDLPKNLTEGTDLASIFTEGTEQPSISITISENKCLLSVSTESGGVKFLTGIKYKGEKLQFTINPDFLMEMMKYTTSIVLTKSKAKLETENFSLLTSLYEE